VFSHNKGGAYLRNGSIPTKVLTDKAIAYKTNLGLTAQGWSGLSDAQRMAWTVYAANNPVTTRLGRTHTLSPLNWFIALNTRLLRAGDTGLTLPPTIGAPVGVLVDSGAVAAGAGTATLTLSTTPLAANHKAWIRAARTATTSIVNVENKLTEIIITDAAAASPIDIADELIANLGALQEGDVYTFDVRIMDDETGLMSAAARLRVTTAA
jgi:hypothetical protein